MELQRLSNTLPHDPTGADLGSPFERLQAALDSTADAIIVLDHELRVVLANRKFAELFHLPHGWEERSPAERLALVTGQALSPAAFSAQIEAISADRELETSLIVALADGRVIDVCATVYRVEGAPAGRVWNFRDATRRERLARELRALTAVAETLNETIDPEHALARGLASLSQRVGASTAWLWSLHGRGLPQLRATYGDSSIPSAGAAEQPCECLRRLASGNLAQPTNAIRCARLALTTGAAVTTHASIPIYTAGRPVGVINLVCGPDHAFDESDLRLFTAVADQFAVAIERARLFEEAREQQAAAEALRAAAAALTATLDPDLLLDCLADQIPRIVRCDALRILLVDGRVARVARSIVAAPGGASPHARRSFDIARSPVLRHMIENEEPITAAEMAGGALLADPASADWIGVPVVAHGVVAAFFFLERRQPDTFQPRHISKLAVLAVHAALALQNARLYADVQHVATLDSLTGVSNRRHLFAQAGRELERARRYGHTIAAIMLDVDYFKQINDGYGHAIGDIVLREVANRCFAGLRDTDILGRYGGEEFAIVLPETQLANAAQVAERLREEIAHTSIVTDAGPIIVSASFGVAAYEVVSGDVSIGRLLDCADRALYAAKEAGRNQVVCWEG
jgi:diguanylate cyclase (GGDEF)-like protein/PAS domain S-box-containing protein